MIKKSVNKFILIFFLFCVCSGLVFGDFVIGMYCVDDVNDFTILKEAGFNTVQIYNKEPEYIDLFATKAKENDMKIVAYPNKIIGSKYQSKVLDYPLCAWYIYDDLDIEKNSKDKLAENSSICKKTFPNDKISFFVGEENVEKRLYDLADILMIDWNRISYLQSERFDYNKQENKMFFATIKLFDCENINKSEKKDNRVLNFYKKEDIRFMSYDAIVSGASGLFYFNYRPEDKPLSQSNPKYWQEIVDIIQELSFIEEIIDKGKEIENPIGIQEPLKAKSFEYGEIKYTILVNPTSKRQTVPKLFLNPKFDVMYEKSTNIKKIVGRGHNNFKPYKVLVFRYE